MQKQAVKTLSFTFHDVSFNVVPTGNYDADFSRGMLITMLFLKVRGSNFDSTQSSLPMPDLLSEVVAKLIVAEGFAAVFKGFLFALDAFLQPLSHAAISGFDKLDIDKLIADISKPSDSADYPFAFENLA